MESIFALGFPLEALILGLLDLCSWADRAVSALWDFCLTGKFNKRNISGGAVPHRAFLWCVVAGKFRGYLRRCYFDRAGLTAVDKISIFT